MGKIPPMEVEKSRKLAPGTYEGRIMGWDLSEREMAQGAAKKIVQYADLSVAVKPTPTEEPITLQVGYPVGKLTPDAFLGRLLARFGVKVLAGETVDVDAELTRLVGRDVVVRVFEENGFSRIDRDSVRPNK